MNFSHVSVSPNTFISMQFNPPTKIVGNIHQGITFVPATTAQSHHPNHETFPSNVQTTSTDMSLQNQHHYQDTTSRLLHLNSTPRQTNPQSTASTAAQTCWTESNNHLPHDTVKSNLPLFLSQLQGRTFTQSIKKKTQSTEMRSVSTMTDFDNTVINDRKNLKNRQSVSCEDSNDSLKCSRDENVLFKTSVCSNSCYKVHLKDSASAMADYLGRLKQSQMPSNIEEFLKKHDIKVNLFKTEQKDSNKDFEDSSRSGSEAGFRLTTALDGSSLYCCSECQVAYSLKEQLDHHLSVHRVDRRFECNVCGVCLKRKEHLDQHKKGHSEERPFVCEICFKGFKRNEHLRRHAVIHSGDKSHVCKQCGKAFSRKDHLTKHLQIHVKKQAKGKVNDPTPPVISAQSQDSQKNLEFTLSSKQP